MFYGLLVPLLNGFLLRNFIDTIVSSPCRIKMQTEVM